MGSKQSALKKEIAALQQEARKRSAKHQEELTTAVKEKRQLQAKIDELQAIVMQAQEEVYKLKSEAREREERTKALKWELVRQLRLTGSPTSTSPRASLSPSSSTRIALNWRLNDDVSLRQSVVSPKTGIESPKESSTPNDTTTSSNPPNLLAPRRSLIKRSETIGSAASPNQASDSKDTGKPSEMTAKPTKLSISTNKSKNNSDDLPGAKYYSVEDAKANKSPRESKSSGSSIPDDSIFPRQNPPSSEPSHDADSKTIPDDNPETT